MSSFKIQGWRPSSGSRVTPVLLGLAGLHSAHSILSLLSVMSPAISAVALAKQRAMAAMKSFAAAEIDSEVRSLMDIWTSLVSVVVKHGDLKVAQSINQSLSFAVVTRLCWRRCWSASSHRFRPRSLFQVSRTCYRLATRSITVAAENENCCQMLWSLAQLAKGLLSVLLYGLQEPLPLLICDRVPMSLIVRERPLPDLLDVLLNRSRRLALNVLEPLEELGSPFETINSQHVELHQYLSIGAGSCSNSNRRNLESLRHPSTKARGDSFDEEGEGSRSLKGLGVLPDFERTGYSLSLNAETTESGLTLRGEANVGHDGDSARSKALNEGHEFFASFQLDGVHVTLLNHPHGVLDTILGGVIGPERQVGEKEGRMTAPSDRATMIQHLVEGEGGGGSVTACDHGERVAYESNVDASSV